MAGGEVARRFELERRRHVPANVAWQRTTAGKDAAGNALLQAWHGARNLGEPRRRSFKRGAELWHRAEQALRVGMPWAAEQLADRRLLDLAAGIHHHHALGDLRHHAEIVGDENDGGADPAA